MNMQVYKQLDIEYQKKRDRALAQAEGRKREVVEKHPELSRIDYEMKKAGLELARVVLYTDQNSNETAADLEARLNQLRGEKEEVLQKLGVSPGLFEPEYECKLCKDTGFITKSGSERCSCYRQKLINIAYRQANLEIVRLENFETFDPEVYPDSPDKKYGADISPRDNMLNIRDNCLNFVENFDCPEEKNLLFTGEPGRGKTFMSNCIAKEMINRGKTVIYQTAPRLLDLIMNYKMRYQRAENFDDAEYNNLFNVDLLIIDDLGAEALNSSRDSEMFNIINTRLLTQKSRHTKTILSTNLSLEAMREYYGTRIMSRILGEFYVYKFFGEDIRLNKGRKQKQIEIK